MEDKVKHLDLRPKYSLAYLFEDVEVKIKKISLSMIKCNIWSVDATFLYGARLGKVSPACRGCRGLCNWFCGLKIEWVHCNGIGKP